MPTQIQVMNRYVPGDPVAGAAITFDHDKEDAKTPRTALAVLSLLELKD